MSVESSGSASAYSNPAVRKALAELAVKVSEQMDDPHERAKLPIWVRDIASSPAAATPTTPVDAAPAETTQRAVVEGLFDNSEFIYDPTVVHAVLLKSVRPNHRHQAPRTGQKLTYEVVVSPGNRPHLETGSRLNTKTNRYRLEVSGIAFEASDNFEVLEIERLLNDDEAE